MKNRRTFLLGLTSGFVALAFVAGTALAAELLGVMTKVDPDAKTVTVIPEGSEKEVTVTITDKTVAVSKKGETPVDFEKLAKAVQKAKDNGAKGAMVKIEHEKNVASKIQVQFKKKADPTR
jgi:hypothetical protein